MKKDKYVAYVSTYTSGMTDNIHGIKIYDVDMEIGRFKEKDQVEITNSSYVTISHNSRYLYSITDFGVEAYKIEKDGSLTVINQGSVNGMRGCYLSTDYEDKYLFVAGYHDGKLTVLRLNEDGSVGAITDEIYHKTMGSIAERSARPHVTCAVMTTDNKYLLVADQGMDHVNVYKFDHVTGKVKLVDILRSALNAAPKTIQVASNGRFLYIINELKCTVDVYRYEDGKRGPNFELLQTVEIIKLSRGSVNSASGFGFSDDYKYLLCSVAGNNSVTVFNVDEETGLLTKNFSLPVSGDYPKDAVLFPDNRHLVSANHISSTLTFFDVDMEKNVIVMHGKEIKVQQPNCIIFHKL